MEIYEHVRFRLSELVAAVQMDLQAEIPPPVPQALSHYWNWARKRGWRLHSVQGYSIPHTMFHRIENGMQVEMGQDEQWNVVWRAEERLPKSCDLLIRKWREAQ